MSNAKKSKKVTAASLKKEVLKNSHAIEQLKDVPEKIEAILQMMQGSVVEPEPSDESNDAIDPIASLLSKTPNVNAKTTDQIEPSLLHALNIMQPEPEYGQPINLDVAKSIADLYSTESSKAIRDKMKDKYKVPENCTALAVPRVNPEIWSMLPPAVKQKDYATQQHQQLGSLAAVAVAKMTDNLFTTTEAISPQLRQDLIVNCMEIASVLSINSDELNKKRKAEMKLTLNREYASICNTSKTSGGLLFGENVMEQLKASKSSSQLIKAATPQRNFRDGIRFSPYKRNTLNSMGPPTRGRGAFRQQRGRPMYRPTQPFYRNRHQQ